MDKSKQQKILQEATLFSSSLFISRIILSIRGIIIPKFLGPIEYGIYNGLLIIPDFLAHFHFGSLSALKREIPFCYGKNDFAKAQRIRNLVFTQYMGTILLSVLIIFLAVTFFLTDRYSSLFIHSLWLICLLIIIQSLVDAFLENLLRTDNRFDVLSSSEIFKSLVGFLIMLVLIWFWHLYGLIASMILAAALKGAYIYYKTEYQLALVWDYKELKRLLRIGFPIILGVMLITFFTSVDRVIIIRYLDARQLGFYALGLTISKFLLIIQTGAYGVLEPKVYRLYGEKGEIEALKKIVWDPLYGMALFFPLIIGLAYIGVPYLIHLFLPRYLPSLHCTKIMIFGSFFFIFTEGIYTFIVAINRQGLIIKVTALGIFFNLILNYILIHLGWGIEGVALGTVATNMIMGITYLVFTLTHFFKGWRERAGMFAQLFYPFLLVGVLMIVLDWVWPVYGRFPEELGIIALKGICLGIVLSPFYWKLVRSIKQLKDFFD